MSRKKRFYIFVYTLLQASLVPTLAQTNVFGSNIAMRTKLQVRGNKYAEQRIYDNGLGDVVQEVQSYPGTTIQSIVLRHEYDEYRRKTKTWLPVTATGSGCISFSNIASRASTLYNADTAPFTLTEYDPFLPSQPSAQYKAGARWQDNNKKQSLTYSEYTGISMFAHEDGYMYTMTDRKYLCTRTVDEDGCLQAEYTDLTGRLMISETSQGKTYYVYNAKGDLNHVLPPVLSEYVISTYGYESDDIPDTDDMMQKYGYIYRYDNQRHCIYKKLPGCAPIYYIYDKAGNCIFSQDGNQRQHGEWTYTIPDKFGRPCVSGICHNEITYTEEPLHSVHVYAEYSGTAASTGGYSVQGITLDSQEMYAAAYYDGYSFIGQHGVPSNLTATSYSGFSIDTSICHGLQTGSATAILTENGVSGYIYSAMYYDQRYNVSQVKTANHLGGTDIISTFYSYTGKPNNIRASHTTHTSASIEERYSYSYDNADRLVDVVHRVDDGSDVTLRHNTYNALGQLTGMSTGGFATTYSYDMHSWLTGISSRNLQNLFEEHLKYADSDNPCYSGNISAMTWKAGNMGIERTYGFAYDSASRLTAASYSEGGSTIRNYDTQYGYDCMGNITSIKRKGLQDGDTYGYIDNLTLSYDGNQLMAVSDAVTDPTYNNAWNFVDGADSATEYEYDENGNLTKDSNRNILSIQYNSLNLPSKITFTDGRTTKYRYSADGTKLRAEYTTAKPASTKLIDYCGNMIYEDLQSKQLLVDGGYIAMDDYSRLYHFYVQDHLGNNRMVVHENGMVEQVNHYYPYGGLMAESTGWNAQRYKYNGKEFDRMHGLDWYDYGARWMDAGIGRWHCMDPLCEKYYNLSPYSYCGGNPINRVDLHGDSITILVDM